MTKNISFEVFNPVVTPSGGRQDKWDFLLVTYGDMGKDGSNRILENGQDLFAGRWTLKVYWFQQLADNIGLKLRIKVDGQVFMIEGWELIDEKKRYYQFTLSESKNG